MSPPPCRWWRRWSCPSAPLAPEAQRSRVFIGKLRGSRALRRVVGEPFQKRISAGSPPQASKAPGGPPCCNPGALPGHSAPHPECLPGPTALKMRGALRLPARAPGSAVPPQGPQNAGGHGLGRGARDQAGVGPIFFKFMQSVSWLYLTLI